MYICLCVYTKNTYICVHIFILHVCVYDCSGSALDASIFFGMGDHVCPVYARVTFIKHMQDLLVCVCVRVCVSECVCVCV